MSSADPSQRIASAVEAALADLSLAGDAAAVSAVANAVIGKKGSLTALRRSLAEVDSAERRRDLGALLHQAMETVSTAAEQRRTVLRRAAIDEQVSRERWDLTETALLVSGERRGRLHLVTQATERLEDVFVGLGFQVAEGPEVESDFYNFEALNMPPSHPARSMWDTLFVETAETGSVVLRTHTSPVQIRVMQEWPPPIYAVMPGRVFRRDTPDATHMPVFHQIEGLVVDRGITFADLAGTIESFTQAFFGRDFTSRLRPSYFPFTEPSAEFDIRRPDGTWIELGGCGMVHPSVLRAGGLDPLEWSGFAFGFGIDRMAKERHGVEDLRDMYSDDVRFTGQFP
jgi:phenylalanyl-tRNA synthetase alpha chain